MIRAVLFSDVIEVFVELSLMKVIAKQKALTLL